MKILNSIALLVEGEVVSLECRECGEEFDFPAYAKRGNIYYPVCPYCDTPLYEH